MKPWTDYASVLRGKSVLVERHDDLKIPPFLLCNDVCFGLPVGAERLKQTPRSCEPIALLLRFHITEAEMKTFARIDWISLGLWAAMWMVAYVVWPHVPDEIPTHWNLSGDVDGVSSRAFGLIFVPLLTTFIVGLLTLFVRAVWIKQSDSVDSTFRGVRRGVLALFAVMHLALVMAALGGAIDVGRVVMTAVGILLAYFGLLLPKVPRNRWFGVRTKATLADDATWKRANKTGSWALVLAGIITVLAAFLPPIAQLVILLMSVSAAAVTSVMSAVRRPSGKTTADETSSFAEFQDQ